MDIGNQWRVTSDTLNVILSRRKRHKRLTGEVWYEWVVVGYFATLKSALQELINQGVRDTKLKDLEAVCQKIDKLQTLIQNASPDMPQSP